MRKDARHYRHGRLVSIDPRTDASSRRSRTVSYVCCSTDGTACSEVEECLSKFQLPLVDAVRGRILFGRMFLLRTANMTGLSRPITVEAMMRASRISRTGRGSTAQPDELQLSQRIN